MRPLNRQELDLQVSGDTDNARFLQYNALADMYNSEGGNFSVKNLAIKYDQNNNIVIPYLF